MRYENGAVMDASGKIEKVIFATFGGKSSQSTYRLKLAVRPCYSEFFELRQIKGKGLGLVAKEVIPRRTRILREKAMLVERSDSDMLTINHAFRTRLSDLEQCDYLTLPRNDSFTNRLYDEAVAQNENADTRDLYMQAVITSIFKTNVFCDYLWPTIARINHDCIPNTRIAILDDEVWLTALKDIAKGDELTIHYDHGHSSLDELDCRQAKFGFICSCTTCRTPTYRREVPRRTLIRRMMTDFTMLGRRMSAL